MVFCARDTRMHDVQSGGTAALKVNPLSYVCLSYKQRSRQTHNYPVNRQGQPDITF